MIEMEDFDVAFSVFRAQYPNTKWPTYSTKAYYDALSDFEYSDVSEAFAYFRNVPTSFPPAASQIAEQARKARIKRNAEANKPVESPEPEVISPMSEQEQIAYISAAGDNLGERLARQFECESMRLGIKPWQTPPPDIAKKRFAAIGKLMTLIGNA